MCDERGVLQRALALPAFEVGGRQFLRRLVFYVEANRVVQVMYPVLVPAESAATMLALLIDADRVKPQ
jgi:hypothetical protein